MDTHERISNLEEAQNLIAEALDLIKAAIRGTGLKHRAEAYIVPTLIMAISDDHDYLGGQPCNLGEMIEAFRNGEVDY